MNDGSSSPFRATAGTTRTLLLLTFHNNIINNFFLDHQKPYFVIMSCYCGECQGNSFVNEFIKDKQQTRCNDCFVNRIQCYFQKCHIGCCHCYEPTILLSQSNLLQNMICKQTHHRGQNKAIGMIPCHCNNYRYSANTFQSRAGCGGCQSLCSCPVANNSTK